MNQQAGGSDQPLELLRGIFDAFDRGDVERAFALMDRVYADDVYFKDPLQEVRGKEAFMAMSRRFFGRGQTMRVDMHSLVRSGDDVFAVYTLRYKPSVGPWLSFEIATHCRVRGDRFVYHRDYWDLLSSVLGSVPGVGTVYRRLAAALG